MPGSKAVAGIILAAGESSRMGTDKALLPLGSRSFLQHLVETLHGDVSPLLVVLGHHARQIEAQIHPPQNVRVLHNPDYRLGQLRSLQVALRELSGEGAAGALVCLVDHPGTTKKVVPVILERYQKTSAPVVIPTCQGRRGHPVLFSSRLFGELLEAPLDQGARSVVRRHAEEVEFVETNWDGILWDVDQPADYQEVLERWKVLTAAGQWPA